MKFGKTGLSPQEEQHIRSQCGLLAGWMYMTLCSGPLATNTTCCYCYISRDDEEYGANRDIDDRSYLYAAVVDVCDESFAISLFLKTISRILSVPTLSETRANN